MKNDKFCFNRTLGYLVLLVLVVIGFFKVMDMAKSTNTASNAKAAEGCVAFTCNNILLAPTTDVLYPTQTAMAVYRKSGNFYTDSTCTPSSVISEGIGNYCRGNTVTNLSGTPVVQTLYRPCSNGNKLYQKGTEYYVMATNGKLDDATEKTNYCNNVEVCVEYSCPARVGTVDTSAIKFYKKAANGYVSTSLTNYYQNSNCSGVPLRVSADTGIGNWCVAKVGSVSGTPVPQANLCASHKCTDLISNGKASLSYTQKLGNNSDYYYASPYGCYKMVGNEGGNQGLAEVYCKGETVSTPNYINCKDVLRNVGASVINSGNLQVYEKTGKYYSDYNGTVELKYSAAAFCQGVWMRYSCYNWKFMFNDETARASMGSPNNNYVKTKDNGATWFQDDGTTSATPSTYCFPATP